MLFSSLIFLWTFLPLVLALVLLSPKAWHNGLLFIASLIFYAWGGVSYTAVLILSILFNYGCGRLIHNWRAKGWAHYALWIGVSFNLLSIIIFKYADFLFANLNDLLIIFSVETLELPGIIMPIGISFYTFQAISYLVDVYRQDTQAQKSPIKLGLYISFFPQLIAGPIVRYHTIAAQIESRKLSWEKMSLGLRRFVLGLAKKVLLANNFGLLAGEIFALDPSTMGAGIAWLGVVLYALQIYYDFSGYSDMAIGLGLLFGFKLPENFNFPYLAKSIREFWRRWHITLGEWFRDYLYIPLGGNKGLRWQTHRNLIIVFFLTGLWHGASWNFIFWGLWHGLFMIIERQAWFPKLNRFFAHSYTLLVVLPAWVLFNSPDFSHSLGYYQAMLGINPELASFDLTFYWNLELSIAFSIGLLGCTPWLDQAWRALEAWAAKIPWRQESIGLVQVLATLLVFMYCTLNLVTSSYNPFIYFRF